MNMGIPKNLEIAQAFCLNPKGCPLQKGCKTYDDRQQKCSACRNKLEKVDLVDLLNYFYTTSTSDTSHKPIPHTTGKSTELSKTQIKNILILHSQGYSINKISVKLHLQFRTVKKVIEKGFKNQNSNLKVEEVEKELRLEG